MAEPTAAELSAILGVSESEATEIQTVGPRGGPHYAEALDVQGLAAILGTDNTTAARLLPAAAAMVHRFAPGAPSSVLREGLIRVASFLLNQPAAAVRSEKIGEVEQEFAPSLAAVMRHSGAAGLLWQWRSREVGLL